MNLNNKIIQLGKDLKISGFDNMNTVARREAILKATKTVTIDDAWEYVKKGKHHPSKTETVEKPKTVEIIPPGAASSVEHKVDVGAPNINVNIPAPVVTVSHGNFTWQHNLRQSLLWANGALVGALGTALLFLASAR